MRYSCSASPCAQRLDQGQLEADVRPVAVQPWACSKCLGLPGRPLSRECGQEQPGVVGPARCSTAVPRVSTRAEPAACAGQAVISRRVREKAGPVRAAPGPSSRPTQRSKCRPSRRPAAPHRSRGQRAPVRGQRPLGVARHVNHAHQRYAPSRAPSRTAAQMLRAQAASRCRCSTAVSTPSGRRRLEQRGPIADGHQDDARIDVAVPPYSGRFAHSPPRPPSHRRPVVQ